MDEATLQRLYNKDHALCLAWFEEHAGTDTTWPKPIREWIVATHPRVVKEKIVLVTQYKGIFKPKWMPYVLSIRSTPKGPYADSPVTYNDDGSWSFRYAREENKGRDGSTRSVVDVELTVNEVRHARDIRTDLYVVDQIRLERLDDGTIRTTGGRVRHWLTWSPADASLSPTRYRYQLPL